MHPLRLSLLLVALAVVPSPGAVEEYLISMADGPIEIDALGRVSSVDLRTSLMMSDEAALEALVKRWTFEPVVENGRAVPVSARAELDLAAVVAEDGSARLGIQQALFFEGRERPGAADAGVELAPPEWPTDAMRSGAQLMLRIALDAQGDSDVIGIDGGWLTGEAAKPDGAKSLKARRAFVDAARTAAGYWNFAAIDARDCVLRVPVRFWLPVEGWQSAALLPAEPFTDARGNCRIEIGRGGEPTSRRITLLTKLRPPLPSVPATADEEVRPD